MSPILGGGNLGSFCFKNVSLPQGNGFVVDRRGLRPRAESETSRGFVSSPVRTSSLQAKPAPAAFLESRWGYPAGLAQEQARRSAPVSHPFIPDNR
jgi:hypothetical protein